MICLKCGKETKSSNYCRGHNPKGGSIGKTWILSEITKSKMRKPKGHGLKISKLKKGNKNWLVRWNKLFKNLVSTVSYVTVLPVLSFLINSVSRKPRSRSDICAESNRRRKGIIYSDSRNRKMSLKMKENWADSIYKDYHLGKMFLGLKVQPNKIETFLDGVIQKEIPNEFIYSGDGKIFIAGRVPDWFNVNGKKQIIELYGNYWHGEKRTGRTKEEEERQRIDHFAKYGYKTLIIWESELKDITSVIRKIKKFNLGCDYVV